MSDLTIWMPLHIDAWQASASVQCMTDAEHRAFLNLLMAAWQSEDCGLPSDDASLAKLSRKRNEWDLIRAVVMEEFDLIDGRYYNAKLLKERRFAEETREKRSDSGRAGAKARWDRKKAVCDRNATASESHTERIDTALQPQCEPDGEKWLSTPTPTLTKSKDKEPGALDPHMIAKSAQVEAGIFGDKAFLTLTDVAKREVGLGVQPEVVRESLVSAWLTFKAAAARLSYHWSAEKFFGEGHWKDAAGWPWKEGDAENRGSANRGAGGPAAVERQRVSHDAIRAAAARRYGAEPHAAHGRDAGPVPTPDAAGGNPGYVAGRVGGDRPAAWAGDVPGRIVEGNARVQVHARSD